MLPMTCPQLIIFTLILFLSSSYANFAVERGSCAFPPIRTDPRAVNAFGPDQEVYLGDVLAEYGQMSAISIDDEALNSNLVLIGNRLVQQLPVTGLNFRFYVADAPYANAFSIVGGRVYVTRKLTA
jgi:predicted Zn-dependent protease